MAVAISRTANPAGVAASGNVATYSNQAIGAAAVDRVVVLCVGTELASSGPTAATIDYGSGAVAMTPGSLNGFGALYARTFYLYVPTGTTATFAVTFGATNPTAAQNHVAVYRVVGANSIPDIVSGANDTDADPITTGAVTVPANGGMLAICADATDTSARTWTGLTKDIDEASGTGAFRFSTGFINGGGSITATVSGANQEDAGLSYLVFDVGVVYTWTANTLANGAPLLGAPELVSVAPPISLLKSDFVNTAPVLGAPALVRQVVLAVNGFEVAQAALPSVALGQHHVLTASPLANTAPNLGTAPLTAVCLLSANELANTSPVLGAPPLLAVVPLAASELVVAQYGALGAPALVQWVSLAASELINAAPDLGNAVFTLTYSLTASALTNTAPVLNAPPLLAIVPLTANELVNTSPGLSAPGLVQAHTLQASFANTAPLLGAPPLQSIAVLQAASLENAAPVIGSGNLAQEQVLTAAGLTNSVPVFGTPMLSVAGLVTLLLGDQALDFGLDALGDADQMIICSNIPDTYAEVLTGQLGTKNFGIGNVFGTPSDGAPGRIVVSAEVTDGAVDADGQVLCWAAIDSANSRLMARGPLADGAIVSAGQYWTLDSFTVRRLGA